MRNSTEVDRCSKSLSMYGTAFDTIDTRDVEFDEDSDQ